MTQLSNLSPADFEDLCRDIASKEYGVRFEAFGPGTDQGFDGRHAKGSGTTVLQAKHYVRSTFSQLLQALKNEKKKSAFKSCSKYLLFTSFSLTPKQKDKLLQLLDVGMQDPSSIWGREDIDQALRRYPEIFKSHTKLWLSSASMLDSILHSGIVSYSASARREIEEDLKVYARNQSYDEAVEKLEAQHILIISGTPGVGKTTLARMLAYSYICEGWKFTAITSLEQGFKSSGSEEREIIFFDDFLGLIELDRASLIKSDNSFSIFIKSIHRAKNKRFILTTRAHIFEEARGLSDRIDSREVQIGKYILDTGKYTRAVKARILFNHICSARSVSEAHIKSLIDVGALSVIIDHKNYNPRVVSYISSRLLDQVEPEDYAKFIIEALDNPELIWRKPFESLSLQKQNLLVALYFMSQYGANLDKLKFIYLSLNSAVCKHYFHSVEPMAFEKGLKDLESGFITITDKSVRFVNPAVRDFLNAYLVEFSLLEVLASGARSAEWARDLWRHGCGLLSNNSDARSEWAEAFVEFGTRIEKEPVWRRIPLKAAIKNDICQTERQLLLMDWWDASGNVAFLDKAVSLIFDESLSLDADEDAKEIPELVWRIRNESEEDCPNQQAAIDCLSSKLSRLLEDTISTESLVRVLGYIDEYYSEDVPDIVVESVSSAVASEMRRVDDFLREVSHSSEVAEHIEHIEEFGKTMGLDVSSALVKCREQLEFLEAMESEAEEDSGVSVGSGSVMDGDMSDAEVESLFRTLLR